LEEQGVGGDGETVGDHGRVQDQRLGELLELEGGRGAGRRRRLVQRNDGTHQLGADGGQQWADLAYYRF
jgi:hypothetical protein